MSPEDEEEPEPCDEEVAEEPSVPGCPEGEEAVELHRPVIITCHRVRILRSSPIGERTPPDPTILCKGAGRMLAIDDVLGDPIRGKMVLDLDRVIRATPGLVKPTKEIEGREELTSCPPR